MKLFELNLDVQGTGQVVASPDHNTGPGGRSWGWKIWLGKSSEDALESGRWFWSVSWVSCVHNFAFTYYLIIFGVVFVHVILSVYTHWTQFVLHQLQLPVLHYLQEITTLHGPGMGRWVWMPTFKPSPSHSRMRRWRNGSSRWRRRNMRAIPMASTCLGRCGEWWDGQKELAGWVSFRDLFVAQSFQRM